MTTQPESLEDQAKVEQRAIEVCDSKILEQQKIRAVHAKQLRSITTKMVTLKIKGKS